MEIKNTELSISKEQLATLPVVNYCGAIEVISTAAEAEKALAAIRCHSVVGFDTETRPSFRKGRTNSVALVQISTGDTCYLFRINRIGFTQGLIDLMEEPAITKVGLSTRDDFHVLARLHEFTPQAVVELQTMVKDYLIADCSLQKIYGILFNARISKSQRLSNWEAETLSPGQQTYASIDAWACLNIYNYLTSGLFAPLQSTYAHPKVEAPEQAACSAG